MKAKDLNKRLRELRGENERKADKKEYIFAPKSYTNPYIDLKYKHLKSISKGKSIQQLVDIAIIERDYEQAAALKKLL